MSVRDTLETIVQGWADRNGGDPSTGKAMVDAFAHELAEKQRAKLIADGYGPSEETGDGYCPCGSCSWCLAQDYIDLIDPKARS